VGSVSLPYSVTGQGPGPGSATSSPCGQALKPHLACGRCLGSTWTNFVIKPVRSALYTSAGNGSYSPLITLLRRLCRLREGQEGRALSMIAYHHQLRDALWSDFDPLLPHEGRLESGQCIDQTPQGPDVARGSVGSAQVDLRAPLGQIQRDPNHFSHLLIPPVRRSASLTCRRGCQPASDT
jgi:hypothetical protein